MPGHLTETVFYVVRSWYKDNEFSATDGWCLVAAMLRAIWEKMGMGSAGAMCVATPVAHYVA
ncbi:hypothetical protein GCM10023188_00550 [Pontibacter saemangeumensis]|uniref:Uncharacterized protein n=1 Tax=Pontibacter saemangeumensis TaxID=1084525 RepID=A0ABP8L5S5_9BACT